MVQKASIPYPTTGNASRIPRVLGTPVLMRSSPEALNNDLASLGPSNSQKYTPCHVPRTSWPPLTGIVTLDPIKRGLDVPVGVALGMPITRVARSNTTQPVEQSLTTSGSAFSLIVTAAVVCGTNTTAAPFIRPSRSIAR